MMMLNINNMKFIVEQTHVLSVDVIMEMSPGPFSVHYSCYICTN